MSICLTDTHPPPPPRLKEISKNNYYEWRLIQHWACSMAYNQSSFTSLTGVYNATSYHSDKLDKRSVFKTWKWYSVVKLFLTRGEQLGWDSGMSIDSICHQCVEKQQVSGLLHRDTHRCGTYGCLVGLLEFNVSLSQ